jgi:hypothetical protein
MVDVLLNCHFAWELRENMLPSYGSIPANGCQSPDPAGFPFLDKDCVDFGVFFEKAADLWANVKVSHPNVEMSYAIVVPTNPPDVVSDTQVAVADAIVEPANPPVMASNPMIDPANSTPALSYSPVLPANPRVNELDSTVKTANGRAVELDSPEAVSFPSERSEVLAKQAEDLMRELLLCSCRFRKSSGIRKFSTK